MNQLSNIVNQLTDYQRDNDKIVRDIQQKNSNLVKTIASVRSILERTLKNPGALNSSVYEDVYLPDLKYEDEEEKSWVNWAKDNKDFFGEFDHLPTIKAIYKHAFAEGFKYKKKYSYEEMMQK